MARADFCRREQSALNRKTQLAKVSPYPLGSSDFISPCREHPFDVLDEDEPGARLDDDAPGIGPEIARIVLPALPASEAMRLARDAANEPIHEAAPRLAVEGSGIAPHRSRSDVSRFHRCHQLRDREGFPLHHADASSARNCQLDSEIESAASGADADDVEPGTYSHTHAASLGSAASASAFTAMV
jgi:hypothetical protein